MKKPTVPDKTPRPFGRPDTAVLANYSPTDSAGSHPDWVKKKFPTYIRGHADHAEVSVREFTHDGHVVRITTTYRVEVDGRPVMVHLGVDEDGQVFAHATPFVTYDSAVELMKAVIDSYREAFTGFAGGGGGSGHSGGHGGHAHPGGGGG